MFTSNPLTNCVSNIDSHALNSRHHIIPDLFNIISEIIKDIAYLSIGSYSKGNNKESEEDESKCHKLNKNYLIII